MRTVNTDWMPSKAKSENRWRKYFGRMIVAVKCSTGQYTICIGGRFSQKFFKDLRSAIDAFEQNPRSFTVMDDAAKSGKQAS